MAPINGLVLSRQNSGVRNKHFNIYYIKGTKNRVDIPLTTGNIAIRHSGKEKDDGRENKGKVGEKEKKDSKKSALSAPVAF